MKTNIKRKLLVIAMSVMLVMASLTPLFAHGEGETPDRFFQFYATTGTILKFLQDEPGAPTEVVIPKKFGEITVKHIADEAFKDCKSITSVHIPDSVVSIGTKAFDGCDELRSVNIPDSVTSIGQAAFAECKNLTSVTIPDSAIEIDITIFYGCTGLKNVNLPNNLKSITMGMFSNCSALEAITIPNNVKAIGDALD